jgi:phosphopantothenate-cysteine ligase
LITSGGTSERIDSIRRITNSGTGRLGRLIAERFADGGAGRIFYIRSETADAPERGPVNDVTVESVADLERAVRRVCADVRVDAVIHAMAVSDYRVKSVTSSGRELRRDAKISSGERELTVALVPAPKIISLFRTLAPSATLVGFKLLDGATQEELRGAARELMRANGCELVLANDAREITGERHVGLLLSDDGGAERFESKKEIAEGIYRAVIARRNGQHRGV